MTTELTSGRTVGAALRAAADEVDRATAALPPADPATVSRRPHPGLGPSVWLAAAAVVAVVAVVVGLATGGGGGTAEPSTPAGGGSRGAVLVSSPARTTSPARSPSPTRSPVCGAAVPVPVTLPQGWTGPRLGAASTAGEPALPGQLVVNWTGPEGSVEARWPASLDPDAGAGTSESVVISVPDGGTPVAMVTVPNRTGRCEVMQLTWFGTVPDGFGDGVVGFTGPDQPVAAQRMMRALVAFVTAPVRLRLVTATRHTGTLPTSAVRCSGGNSPNVHGSVTQPPAGTPEAALGELLRSGDAVTAHLQPSGWTKLVTPAGRVTFAVPFDGGAGWVQLVVMRRTAGGWLVERWESSGC
jgi:hypothetical protein